MVSVSLMSILPLLVSAYLVSSQILPLVGLKLDVLLSLFISLIIALIGFFVTKEIFDRILSVVTDAKLIAAGDLTRRAHASNEDEVGDLGEALNKLTQRVRSNMDELKVYSERTTEINLDIQKKVIVLSSLLQISSQISRLDKLDDILKVAVEKARLLASSDLAYLFYREGQQETFFMRIAEGLNSDYLYEIKISPTEDAFYEVANSNRPLAMDKKGSPAEEVAKFLRERLKLKNTLMLPVYLHKRVVAVLGIGNAREDFAYTREDIDLLDVFAKQIAIAVENDMLSNDVKKLKIKDDLTGLYNKSFMVNRLQEEIKRAIVYRRPCAFILLDIDNFNKYSQAFGSLQAESVIKRVSALIEGLVTEIDRVGRIGDDEFAVILPEKNKRQARELAENIRKEIEFAYSENSDAARKVTVSAGVSENPLDGISADELLSKADELLGVAKKSGKNRVVIFKEH
jgi:diguanylate cyclase (GGDEF)-like protein